MTIKVISVVNVALCDTYNTLIRGIPIPFCQVSRYDNHHERDSVVRSSYSYHEDFYTGKRTYTYWDATATTNTPTTSLPIPLHPAHRPRWNQNITIMQDIITFSNLYFTANKNACTHNTKCLASMVMIMAWNRKSDKPLSEPMTD